jgi:iron complex outermembrane receptor protein
MNELIDLLHQGGCSCVIRNGSETRTFHQRGVADLWDLCQHERLFLKGAQIADKVVGKGAAALMIYGGVSEIHADIISRPALELLQANHIRVDFLTETDGIMNRRNDGPCPVETLCIPLQSVTEMVKEISNFINKTHNGKNN